MKKILLSLLPFVLVSCEKEISLDYREVDALYVVEACLTQDSNT